MQRTSDRDPALLLKAAITKKEGKMAIARIAMTSPNAADISLRRISTVYAEIAAAKAALH